MPRSLVVAVLFAAFPVFAQDLESFAGLRLRFESPGARSAAMGGVSEALSDSFTAATNPASLAHQRKGTAAIELRSTSSDTPYVTGGTLGSFTTATFENSSRGLRSAIVVLPARTATWAFFADEPVNASVDTMRVRSIGGNIGLGVRGDELVPIDDCSTTGPDCNFIYFSAPAIISLAAEYRVSRYGAAVGRAFGPLSLGGSVQYAELSESVDGISSGQRAHDSRVTWNAGAQLDLGSRMRLGASYRGGASYDAERKVLQPGGFEWVSTEVRTPSSMAAGFAADVTPSLTFGADVVRVKYSEMLRGNFLSFIAGSNATTRYEFPDVTELRAGAEYRLPTRVPVALRAGWWREPSHRVRVGASSDPALNESMNLVMLRDRDENHLTAGIGVGTRVRVDAAIDRSENTTRASLGVSTAF